MLPQLPAASQLLPLGTFSVTTCPGTAHGDCPKESLPTGLLCAHTEHLHTGASFLPARGPPSSRKDIT